MINIRRTMYHISASVVIEMQDGASRRVRDETITPLSIIDIELPG